VRKYKELLFQNIFFFSALIAVAGVFFITVFVFREGWPLWRKYGVLKMLFGPRWAPGIEGEGVAFGMAPLLMGSFYVTVIAAIMAVPLGVGCAVFLAELSTHWWAKALRPAISLLAAIPSVVYGFFGLIVIVPLIRKYLGGLGFSLLAGGGILAIMILPTIISVSEDALHSVPKDYKEASLALGATHWQTIYKVLIPAAQSWIIAGIILGMGRALGETMAVILVTGNRPLLPSSPLDPGVTLTGTIGTEWAYAAGDHARSLFAVGSVLFLLNMVINSLAHVLKKRRE